MTIIDGERHLSAEDMGHLLHAVADAQHRNLLILDHLPHLYIYTQYMVSHHTQVNIVLEMGGGEEWVGVP